MDKLSYTDLLFHSLEKVDGIHRKQTGEQIFQEFMSLREKYGEQNISIQQYIDFKGCSRSLIEKKLKQLRDTEKENQ